MGDDLRVLDASRLVVDEVNDLLARCGRRMLYEFQLREAIGSVSANIREAYGRGPGAERKQFLRYARGSADEADEHLRVNFAARRILANRYWRIHNRLVTIRRMLTALINR